METKIKKGLLYAFLVFLFLPMANQQLHFIKSGELNGGFKDADNVSFSIHGWAHREYQAQKERYLNDNTGFRPDMVRLNNQIDYSLFDKCHAGWDIKGTHGYLFEWPYIDAYYGKDFSGYQTIYDKCIKLKAIQDTLFRLGKSLILVYAPSKASYYPEYFPKDRIEKKRVTNYEVYHHLGDSLGINQVDMDAWFVAMKGKSKEPLFSKQGIHWSKYGAALGADSIMSYIANLRSIHLEHPAWSKMEYTDKLRGGDDDVARELNLIFPVAKETMAYPIVADIPDSMHTTINDIFIGDSYGYKMVDAGIITRMSRQCEYWSNFRDVLEINNNNKYTQMKDYDWHAAIKKTDCVVLVYTLFNFKDLGNGFIEQAYDYYYPDRKIALKN